MMDQTEALVKGGEQNDQEGSRAPEDDSSGVVSDHGLGRVDWAPLDASVAREKAVGEVADQNNHI